VKLARITGILVQGILLGVLLFVAVAEIATSSGARQIFYYEGF